MNRGRNRLPDDRRGEATLLALLCLAVFAGLAAQTLIKEMRMIWRVMALIGAASLVAGCSAVRGAPGLTVMADRPGCSSVARAFMSQDGTELTADQILAGVAQCEARDRMGALTLGPEGF